MPHPSRHLCYMSKYFQVSLDTRETYQFRKVLISMCSSIYLVIKNGVVSMKFYGKILDVLHSQDILEKV